MDKTTFTYQPEENTVIIERIFDAPLEKVWQTITNPDLIPRWWGPEKYPVEVERMEFKVGGGWRFMCQDEAGNSFAFSGTYRVIEPPHKLVQTFNFEPMGPGHESVETSLLKDLGDGRTLMRVTAVYPTREDFEGTINAGMEEGARETWQRLATLLENDEKVITISRLFDAPVERVWQAWTKPEQVALWWGPEGFQTEVEELDLRPGGKSSYVMIGPDGTRYPVGGTFIEVEPYKKIVSTDEFGEGYDDANLPQGMIMTVLFEPINDQTRLTLHIAHPSVEEKQKHEQMGVVAGWHSTLDCLEGWIR